MEKIIKVKLNDGTEISFENKPPVKELLFGENYHPIEKNMFALSLDSDKGIVVYKKKRGLYKNISFIPTKKPSS